jgi:hypothetical protein
MRKRFRGILLRSENLSKRGRRPHVLVELSPLGVILPPKKGNRFEIIIFVFNGSIYPRPSNLMQSPLGA